MAEQPGESTARSGGAAGEPAPPKTADASHEVDELLSAANEASGPARNAWLAFLGVQAYLLVTLGGITHKDILLGGRVRLPIVNTEVVLYTFFLLAPFLLVLIHLSLLVQHASLAHKYHQFLDAVAESGEARDHLKRRLVHGYVFAQLLAGPMPPLALGLVMRAMVWATLSVLPIITLLYFQIKFLPYHSVFATHTQRLAILFDIVLLFTVRPFYGMPLLREGRPKNENWWKRWRHLCARWIVGLGLGWGLGLWRRLRRASSHSIEIGRKDWPWRMSVGALAVSVVTSSLVLLFSLLVATVPDGCFWSSGRDCFSLDRKMAAWPGWAIDVRSTSNTRPVFYPTKLLFEGDPDPSTRVPKSPFARNLVLADTDLVPDQAWEPGEISVSLQQRNLRSADLQGSDFHRADFDGGILKGASLVKANLQGAHANSAELQGADLAEASLQGAYLRSAHLEGTDLRFAHLEGANLAGAYLRGASLDGAHLEGAILENADLQGAILSNAFLHGASLRSAKLQGADLRSAMLWQTNLGEKTRTEEVRKNNDPLLQLADLRRLDTKRSSVDVGSLERVLKDLENNEDIRGRVEERIAPLLAAPAEAQADSNEWSTLQQDGWSPPDPMRLASFLARLACDDDTENAYIAQGLIRRAASGSNFNGDSSKFNEEFRACVTNNPSSSTRLVALAQSLKADN